MKKSELSFVEGFTTSRAKNNNPHMTFDWDKAAEEIKKYLDKPNLIAEAGLQGDWNYTGGEIFENGLPTNESYTYLSSNWATPTLLISFDGCEELELPCFTTDEESRFDEGSKWDEQSLKILGISLKEPE